VRAAFRIATQLGATRRGRITAIAGGLAIVWAILAVALPEGLPLGIVLLGVVIGSLSALTALGLVLVWRASRIINFAQAEIGGLAAAVAVILVLGARVPYFVALVLGLAAALATGALVDVVVVRRFFTAPRLILTVATIGLAQIFGGLRIILPSAVADLSPTDTFGTQFDVSARIGPVVFNGDHLFAVGSVGVILIGLAWFLRRSDTGIAIRGAGESGERLLLLGIPIRRLSTITWTIAAGMSGIGAMLSAPILGPQLGAFSGPETLLAPLAAAVIGGMESLPVAFAASIGIGIAEQAIYWSYPRSSTVDLSLFVLVLVALLVRRRRTARVDGEDAGSTVAVREVRPIPEALRRLPEVRAARIAIALAAAGVLVAVPLLLDNPRLILGAFTLIYAIVAVSLVVLAGWAGQVSLGQFAFVGLGAGVTGGLIANAGADLFVALVASAATGGAAAVFIGLPALRIRGLMLAATTLAFAVPVSTLFLNSAYFPAFAPRDVARPAVFDRFDLESPLAFYYFCLIALILAVVLARNFRRSRVGRVVIAVRDNERGAASFSISPTRAKLTAFVFSGMLAGFAGGLHVLGTHGIGYRGFAPLLSLEAFTVVVVGGLGSLPGALFGAAYVSGIQYFLHGGARFLATGAGLLVLLMFVTGGLGQVMYAARDALLRRLARRRRIEVPALIRTDERGPVASAASAPPSDGSILDCRGIDAGYGKLQVLFDVELDLQPGEILALLGTNGAGKSTLAKVIAGLVPATRGDVLLDGVSLGASDPVTRVRTGVVLVPGGGAVLGTLTVAENLRLAGVPIRRNRRELAEAYDRVYELFPVLRERLTARAASLSGGEQRMLALAMALFAKPRVLVIDELSLGLSPIVVSSLLEVVRTMSDAGTAVIVVEQSVNVATAIARRTVFMERGRVAFMGDRDELVARPDLLRAVFLKPASARTRPAKAAAATNGGTPRLAVEGVVVRFGGVMALAGVDLTVAPGRVLGIIGANGAGKTTLFDVCSGFLRPDAGTVRFDGVDVTALSPWDRADRGMGRSAQDARLFPSLTVAEALAVALERHVEVREPIACLARVLATVESENAVARRVAELLEQMGLGPYRDMFVSELSTGTRRILDLACALAHDPDLLLLDEPSTGIAQREIEALGELLVRIGRESHTTLVLIEHDIPLVSAVADELVCMHLGLVASRGTPRAVLSDPAVVAAYLGTDDVAIARSGKRSPAARRRAKQA
jgi:ABC-type branched-subunit amino acid transport system ATPase component/ABC-type branched-subunit amino acid transport system permease subunit